MPIEFSPTLLNIILNIRKLVCNFLNLFSHIDSQLNFNYYGTHKYDTNLQALGDNVILISNT